MTADDHTAAIRGAIDAAIVDKDLTRAELREVLEEAEDQCATTISALDEDEGADTTDTGEL